MNTKRFYKTRSLATISEKQIPATVRLALTLSTHQGLRIFHIAVRVVLRFICYFLEEV